MHWSEVVLEELRADSQRVARAVFRSKNAAAIASVLQLVRDLENGKLQRLREVDAKTNRLDELCCRLLDDVATEERRKDALKAENIALMQERQELERSRDELRAAIEAEADAAGSVLLDDEPGEVADALPPAAA